jgi:hypothetical protein
MSVSSFAQRPLAMVGFPLLLIPLAVYNIIVFLMPTVSLGEPVLRLTLMSGAEWGIALGDMLLAFAALMLLFEVIKGARPGAKYLTDHLLSLLVFGAAAAEFLLWPKFGTSIYFLLTLFALVDFLAGVSLRRRRGAVPVAAAPVASKRGRDVEASAAEPQFEPPAAPAPSAASVAESVLLDHPEPSPAQQPAAAPAMPSPGIQPNGTHPHPDTPPR